MSATTHATPGRASLVAVALCLVLHASALAGDSLAVKSDTAYRLNPGQENVSVVVDVTMTNRAGPTYSVRPCSAGSSRRCRFKTSYYYDEWGYIYVPVGANKARFSSGVRARLDKKTRYYRRYQVSFPRLDYGRSRTFTVRYVLPGGKPRSQHETRVLDAYSYFCWHGQPGDTGSVSVRMPPGYKATTWYGQTKTKAARKSTTIDGRVKGNPGKFYACTDATKPGKLLRTKTTSPGGQQVTVEGWPEDPAWSEMMGQAIEDVLPELEELIGEPLPLDKVTIREVTRQSLDGYGSNFGLRNAMLRLGDHIDSPAGAARGLAWAWFNDRRIDEAWLRHGLGDWAGYKAIDEFCTWPGTYPGKGKPRLRTWKRLKERPTERQVAIVDWQYDMACWLIQKSANRVGTERMREVIAALVNGTTKYGPQPGRAMYTKRKPATWRDWLDAIDEVGMVPAGWSHLTISEQDLRDQGIATRKELKGRAPTRKLYHEALEAMDGTVMPRLVNDAMGRWDWKTARKAIAVSRATHRAIVEHEEMAEADRLSLMKAFAAADSFKALRDVKGRAKSYAAGAPEDD